MSEQESSTSFPTYSSSLSLIPTISFAPTSSPSGAKTAEEEHSFDAYTALLLNAILIVCVLLSYYIKANKIYYLPER